MTVAWVTRLWDKGRQDWRRLLRLELPISIRVRLLGESLESRIVPSTYYWNPVSSHSFNQPTNWIVVINNAAEQPAVRPGPDDDIVFDAKPLGVRNFQPDQMDCDITTGVSVHSMKVQNGFASKIALGATLTITGTAEGNSLLTLDSPATIAGSGTSGVGKIVLAQWAGFNWHTGTLQDVTVDIERSGSTNAFLRIANNPGGVSPKMSAVTINVDGDLKWMAQDVVNLGSSSINITTSGVFEITAEGKTWGVNAADLAIQNNGTVTLNSGGTATIIGKYTNAGTGLAGKGLTDIVSGTLKINGTYEQTMSTAVTRLASGSILEVTGPNNVGIVEIFEGQLQGSGSINSTELQLGRDPAPNQGSGNPIVVPGSVNTIGTLTVNAYFRMYGGQVHAEISSEQVHDEVAVTNGVWLSNIYQDPNGVPFLRAGSISGILIGNHAQIPNPSQKIPVLTWTGNRHGEFLTPVGSPQGYHFGYEDVAPKNFWFQKSGGGGGSGGGGSGGSSPLMAELTWDDQETSDLRQDKAAVKLFDASGNFLAASADDWAGPAAFGGLGEGSYRVDYVKPSPARSMASKPVRHDPGAAPPWIQMPRTDDDDQSYDIDAELSIS